MRLNFFYLFLKDALECLTHPLVEADYSDEILTAFSNAELYHEALSFLRISKPSKISNATHLTLLLECNFTQAFLFQRQCDQSGELFEHILKYCFDRKIPPISSLFILFHFTLFHFTLFVTCSFFSFQLFLISHIRLLHTILFKKRGSFFQFCT